MAIYQYYLAILPISESSTDAPTQLAIPEGAFFTHAVSPYWKQQVLSTQPLMERFDKIIQRAHWGHYCWKSSGEVGDNDINLDVNKETELVESLYFRADLRITGLPFLESMIALVHEHNWLFMDVKGKILIPDKKYIYQNIKESNAFRFLQNPEEYLKSL